MNILNTNIIIASIFIVGIWSFFSGQFIVSTVIFGSAAIYSIMANRVQLNS